jgi:glycosyltransferase involved in cell wall biosynthesis
MKKQLISLDDRFSTTRMLVTIPNKELRTTDGHGLRKKGFTKTSHPQKPLISVIIVVLNRITTLENSIKSVVNQQYNNVELIIIDGGSSDGSLDIIRSYDHYIDYWTSEPDSGVYHAMNKGAGLACGEWLYFLGSDDILLDCLHKVAHCLIDNKTVYYGDVYLPTSHRLADGKFDYYKLMTKNIPHQATFYPRGVFKNYLYNTTYFSSADYDLNLRCYCDKNISYAYIPILIAIYEDTSGLSTLRLDMRFEEDFLGILKQNFPRLQYYEYLLRMLLKSFERRFIRKFTRFMRGK